MNFEDERYVRVYTRKTVTTKLLGWEGRMCLHALLLEVDRAGVLELEGMDPAEALAAMADIPIEHVRVGMARLLERGVALVRDGRLFLPRFLEAQEARQSDAQRQRESRGRRAAELRSSEGAVRALSRGSTGEESSVTNRDHIGSQDVTESHTQSHEVTSGHSVLSSAVLSSAHGEKAPARAPKARRAPDKPELIRPDWQPPESVVAAQATRWQATREQLLRTVPEFRDYWAREGKRRNEQGWIRAWTNRLEQLGGNGKLWVEDLRAGARGATPPGAEDYESRKRAAAIAEVNKRRAMFGEPLPAMKLIEVPK